MLRLDLESNANSKTAWLRSYLGFSTDMVVRVLTIFPDFLRCSVENLEGKVRLVVMVLMLFLCPDTGTSTARFIETNDR